MLDRWLLNVQRQILHTYLEGGQVQQFIEKTYRNVEGILQLELWFLTASGKLLKVEQG
jgi:hypothetical protein